jgi:hypothetical protein
MELDPAERQSRARIMDGWMGYIPYVREEIEIRNVLSCRDPLPYSTYMACIW